MPLPIYLAHRLAKRLADVRKDGTLEYLRPDGKTQVTVEYHDGKPVRIENVVVSTQHSSEVELETIKEDIMKHVIMEIVPQELLDKDTKYYVNPTGRFVIGGPQADTGMTGRKIIVDTYGGVGSHGGGCFSGKDPTKVDRSASYMARYLAKNIVASGSAKKCEIQLSYAIGVIQPVSIYVDSFGTGSGSVDDIYAWIKDNFDLSPAGIIKFLDLRKPIFQNTAAYGHFGRKEFSWEQV